MHDDRVQVELRLTRLLEERVRPAVHARKVPLTVRVWHVPGEPAPVAQALAAPYRPVAVGDAWGPPWSTSWFEITGRVPPQWAGQRVEAVVDLGFGAGGPGFRCEGLAYTGDGQPVKGLAPRTSWLPVACPAVGGEQVLLYVEAAANPRIQPPLTELGDPSTAGEAPLYRLTAVDLAVLDEPVWELVQDLEVLGQLMHELSLHEPRTYDIVRAVERSLDALDLQDVSATAEAAREQLAEVLARPASASAHRLSAVGHAHIDSAWLWPLREAVRKVARTASNVTALMVDHPDFRFAMSSAQQLAWLGEHHPAVFERVRERVKSGQFVPVGGMWVESDTNMPGGEAMARQFVHGKRFFLAEFGVETEEVWLPDSFGYSAALPQLVALSGSRWFLSQKISWNTTNKFPHHTFLWEGIDGTRVFTHFPPADTYSSDLSGAELAHASRNFADKGWTNRSLLPFGHGDGGGGPTREMLARAARTADLEGSPRVELASPAEFFTAAQAEYPNPPVWSGELYLERHRATYTSQARTKQGNRRSEHLLHEAELWSATAAVAGLVDYPYEQLDRLWKRVLLHQFHDILPGSSIAWVHHEAEQAYSEIAEALAAVIDEAQRALAGPSDGTHRVVFNAAPHARDGIAGMGAAATPKPAGSPVTVSTCPDGHVLDNGSLRATVDSRGLVTSLVHVPTGREAVAPGCGANLLQMHPDLPLSADAWDVDSFYRNTVTDLTDVEEVHVVADGGQQGAVRVVRRFGSSRVEQVLRLVRGQCRLDVDTIVDWHETEKFLKAAFPLDVHADRSTAEIQFGHVHRPTHTNTSWDAARFEICAHRWLHVAEPGYGVAIVNDSIYGHDVTRTTRAHGGTTTTVRLSLLRAPRFPDPHTDQGLHRFHYAVVVGADIPDAVREGYRINLPERSRPGSATVQPLACLDGDGATVETVKLADDRSGDVVVRVYEAHGGHVTGHLRTSFPLAHATETDLLERPLAGTTSTTLARGPDQGSHLELRLRPFQVLTLRLQPSRETSQEGAP